MNAAVAVAGIWHQGMVLAAGLAGLGHDVRGICPPDAARELMAGRPLLHEPGLSELLSEGVATGRLRFTPDADEALAGAEFAFLSNDTPVDDHDVPVLDAVYDTARLVAENLSAEIVLCVSAQVPVGTTEDLRGLVTDISSRDCEAAYVPEFLRLGAAVETFRNADRFVIGADSDFVAHRVGALFERLGRPIIRTSIRTAEMAKHAANSFLATSISFANEVAELCDAVGASVADVVEILRLDRRIGPDAYLRPGLGFAGATLARDLRALQRIGAASGVATRLADAALAVNADRAPALCRRFERSLGSLEGRRIALLGLTYKAGTSTLRRAASLEIAAQLAAAGASVRGYDPLVDPRELPDSSPVEVFDDPYEAASGCDALTLVTEWAGIEDLDLRRLRNAAAGPLLLDAQGRLSAVAARAAGFEYVRIGG